MEKILKVWLSIDDLKKIKSRFKKTKSGKIGVELIALPCKSEYSDGMLIESLPEAEREEGKRGVIVGSFEYAGNDADNDDNDDWF